MDWWWSSAHVWPLVALALLVAVAAVGAGHAVLYKRDPRAAALWVSVIWILPLFGTILYFILGVNRIRRQAVLLRRGLRHARVRQPERECAPEALVERLPGSAAHLVTLARATSGLLPRPLLLGNRVEPLVNGDEAYPAMLAAIEGARHTVTLSTYIFDRDDVGLTFVRALGAAVRRGVQVRVLVDATGAWYSWPTITGALRREGVPYARFLPTFPIWQVVSLNLRNHRKLLVVDGHTGFTGGMNIRAGHWLARNPSHPVRDVHFRLDGPIVAHLQEAFADDWAFTTGEALRGGDWFPSIDAEGPVVARGIADGPDEDLERLRWTLLSALGAARSSVRLATPYFLPDQTLIAALTLAAMRGVAVHILVPARGNLPFVQWASTAHWWQVLSCGCRLFLSPPPFDHSKLLVVDDAWALVGSTNWDPRSLRLNFEFNVECYDAPVAGRLAAHFDALVGRSHETSLAEVDARSLPVRLRDGVARLFTPYL